MEAILALPVAWTCLAVVIGVAGARAVTSGNVELGLAWLDLGGAVAAAALGIAVGASPDDESHIPMVLARGGGRGTLFAARVAAVGALALVSSATLHGLGEAVGWATLDRPVSGWILAAAVVSDVHLAVVAGALALTGGRLVALIGLLLWVFVLGSPLAPLAPHGQAVAMAVALGAPTPEFVPGRGGAVSGFHAALGLISMIVEWTHAALVALAAAWVWRRRDLV